MVVINTNNVDEWSFSAGTPVGLKRILRAKCESNYLLG